MAETEVEVAGQTYRIGDLNNRQARNVLKRLAPMLAMGLSTARALITAMSEELGGSAEDFFQEVGPLAQAIAALSDADSDYVVETCLSAVMRKTPTNWTRILPPGAEGQLQFQDINLPAQMQLVFHVLRSNYSDFFPTNLGQSNEAPGQG